MSLSTKNQVSSAFRDIKWLAGSLYAAKLLSMPCSIITARVLGPFLYGTWNALRLVLSYAAFLQLGIFDGLSREIPYAMGSKQDEKVLAYKETGFTISLLAASLGTIALLAASLVMERRLSDLVIYGIRVMAIVVFFSHLYGFYEYVLRGEQNFVLVSRARLVYAVGGAVLQVAGVVFFGIHGVFFSVVLINALIVAYLVKRMRFSLRFPRMRVIVPLVRSGVPMLLNGMATSLFSTMDRIMILAFLGTTELGYYAIAVLAANLVDFIPSAVYNVLLPRMMQQAGMSSSPDDLRKFWLEPLCLLSFVLPLFVGLGWILAPVAVRLMLPNYISGILALKILIFGTCFASVPILTRNLFVAVNKQYRVLGAYLAATAVGLALNYTFLLLGWGISGVAIATTLSYLFLGILNLYMAVFIQGLKAELLNIMVRVYAPIMGVAAGLVVLELLMPGAETFREELMNTGIKLGIFLALTLPMIYLLEKQTRLVSRLILQARKTTA